jgi:AraC-like DNA-binding protein
MQIDTSRPSFGFACWGGDPTPMVGAHRHDDIELNVADQPVGYLINGKPLTIPAGRAGIFWGSRPHQLIEVAPGTRVVWLTIPLSELLAWELPSAFVAALIRGELIVPDVAPTAIGANFAGWGDDLRSNSSFLVATARLEVNAFIRRLSLAPRAGTRSVTSDRGDTVDSVAAMAGFIAVRFVDPISVADVAACVHLHPSYAMALFKRVLGVSIGGYLTQCRIAEAQRLLITTRIPVGDVAVACGFGSLSRFFEVFRSSCETTPADYRRRHWTVSSGGVATPTPAR